MYSTVLSGRLGNPTRSLTKTKTKLDQESLSLLYVYLIMFRKNGSALSSKHGLSLEQEDAIVAWKTSPPLSLARFSRQVDEEHDAHDPSENSSGGASLLSLAPPSVGEMSSIAVSTRNPKPRTAARDAWNSSL